MKAILSVGGASPPGSVLFSDILGNVSKAAKASMGDYLKSRLPDRISHVESAEPEADQKGRWKYNREHSPDKLRSTTSDAESEGDFALPIPQALRDDLQLDEFPDIQAAVT